MSKNSEPNSNLERNCLDINVRILKFHENVYLKKQPLTDELG